MQTTANPSSSKNTIPAADDDHVGDLLHFDSWDYDCSLSSLSSAAMVPPTAQAHAPAPAPLSTYGNNSFQPVISSSFQSQKYVVAKKRNDDITVVVSGVNFKLKSDVFARLETLPWQLTSKDHYSLNTSVELFEIILNHLIFDSLPELRLLSKADVEELEPMALILGLSTLEDHLTNNNDLIAKSLSQRRRMSFRGGSKRNLTAADAVGGGGGVSKSSSFSSTGSSNCDNDRKNTKQVPRLFSRGLSRHSKTAGGGSNNKSQHKSDLAVLTSTNNIVTNQQQQGRPQQPDNKATAANKKPSMEGSKQTTTVSKLMHTARARWNHRGTSTTSSTKGTTAAAKREEYIASMDVVA